MTYERPNMFYDRESWGKPLVLSFGFHTLVVLAAVALSVMMNQRVNSNWGEDQGDAVVAKLYSGAPIPLPKPDVQTENIVANDSKGTAQTLPQPKTVEPEDAVPIPSKVEVKPKIDKPVKANNVKPRVTPTPTSVVPYGDRGPVNAQSYATFTAANTKGGFSFENASYGAKYGWYLDVIRRKVQENWLTYEIDPQVNAPHRAYIDFDILRDGTVSNIQLVQSSGIPTLDQSAMRAIKRVDSFGTLPEGSRFSVEFWFDYPPK
ncbi:MAG TPA: TonB family protein [Candidatus Angelobacter sp.]|nr:TonB family protein [Candidatus Angelobacter sp.]